MPRKYKAWVATGVLVIAAVVAYLPAFVHDRNTAASRAAIHNLREIDKSIGAGAVTSELIAHYRFDTNGNDSLGRSPVFVVTNSGLTRGSLSYAAVINPPFTNGFLYVNGQYEPNAHFANYLSTAPIKDLRYESFTVALDFYPLPKKRGANDFNKLEDKLDLWTGGRYSRWLGFDKNYNTVNILTGGYSYRWIGFNREHGLLNLTLNNQAFVHRFENAAVKPGCWHNVTCSVDLQRKKILTFFDGRLLETITLPSDFKVNVVGSRDEETDREFTFSNLSNGSVFYGYAAHLKIFGRALTEAELAGLYSESVSERPTFPEPVFDWMPMVLGIGLLGLALFLILWLRKRAASHQRSPTSLTVGDQPFSGSNLP
jgi:hypothetical protein